MEKIASALETKYALMENNLDHVVSNPAVMRFLHAFVEYLCAAVAFMHAAVAFYLSVLETKCALLATKGAE